jgi:hypothetical protein
LHEVGGLQKAFPKYVWPEVSVTPLVARRNSVIAELRFASHQQIVVVEQISRQPPPYS